MSIEEEVLAEIKPSGKEIAAMEATMGRLLAAAKQALATIDPAIEATVQGSIAKETWLRGDVDVDMFLLFPADADEEALLDVPQRLAGLILKDARHRYAQHPYLVGGFEGVDVDLVPAYAITDAKERRSAVDRTPLHTAWVREHLDAGRRDEVRLLKRFLKGIEAYGAETAKGGFSGYLVEILVAWRGFSGVLSWLAAGAPERRISLGEDDVTDAAPLIVVDPVDPARNCAAAVREEVLRHASEAARAYEEAPSRAFYFPPPRRAEPITVLEATGVDYVAIILRPLTERLDLVFPQFQRLGRTLATQLVEAGYTARHEAAELGGEVILQYAVRGAPPATRVHRGPKAEDAEHAARFAKKWQGHVDALGPPRLERGRIVVDVRVAVSSPATLVAARLQGLQSGKHAEAAKGSARVVGLREVPSAFLPLASDFILERRPWQR